MRDWRIWRVPKWEDDSSGNRFPLRVVHWGSMLFLLIGDTQGCIQEGQGLPPVLISIRGRTTLVAANWAAPDYCSRQFDGLMNICTLKERASFLPSF